MIKGAAWSTRGERAMQCWEGFANSPAVFVTLPAPPKKRGRSRGK